MKNKNIAEVSNMSSKYRQYVRQPEGTQPKTEEYKAAQQPIRIEVCGNTAGTTVFVGGVEISNLKNVSVTHNVGKLPTVKLEILALHGVEINGIADIEAFVKHLGE